MRSAKRSASAWRGETARPNYVRVRGLSPAPSTKRYDHSPHVRRILTREAHTPPAFQDDSVIELSK